MAFQAFRTDGFPTLYESMKTPVTADVLEIGFIFAAVIVAFSFFLVIPGLRGKGGIFVIIRFLVGLIVLVGIMLCNFGQEWEVSHVDTVTPYRAGARREINATIGVKIGLRSVNITLKGNPEYQNLSAVDQERINYNERFHWDNLGWTQGRLGFGPFAGLFNQEFRAAQRKGLPIPILWIAEYFTFDGEGFRFGRFYRQAGYYTHIMVWSAFPLWILTIILSHMVLRYSAYFSMLTGFCLLVGNILYASIRNANKLTIPFNDGDTLDFSFGPTFIFNLILGIITLIIGIVMCICDICIPDKLATFFGHDITQDFEEIYGTADELGITVSGTRHDGAQNKNGTIPRKRVVDVGIEQVDVDVAIEEDECIYENPEEIHHGFRKRAQTKGTKRFQKSQKRKPRPAPRNQKAKASVPEPQTDDPAPSRSNGQGIEMRSIPKKHVSIKEEDSTDDEDDYENVNKGANFNPALDMKDEEEELYLNVTA